MNKVINKGTNKEQMLRIFKIRFLLENHRQLYSADISEQDIFQSTLLIYSNIYLSDFYFRQADRNIIFLKSIKNHTNTKLQEKIN